MGFPGGSVVENPPVSAEAVDLIPGSGRSLEKKMATHSSVPAWRTPWRQEPGGPQSMGSQRVRDESETEHQAQHLKHTFTATSELVFNQLSGTVAEPS